MFGERTEAPIGRRKRGARGDYTRLDGSAKNIFCGVANLNGLVCWQRALWPVPAPQLRLHRRHHSQEVDPAMIVGNRR